MQPAARICLLCQLAAGRVLEQSVVPSRALHWQKTPACSTGNPQNNSISPALLHGAGLPKGTQLFSTATRQGTTPTTRSGYRESSDTQRPPDQLKITLRPEQAAIKQEDQTLDFYQVTQKLFSEGEQTSQKAVEMDADAAATLNKFVGVLTKEGKKSKAHRIVLDAMRIIRKNLHNKDIT